MFSYIYDLKVLEIDSMEIIFYEKRDEISAQDLRKFKTIF